MKKLFTWHFTKETALAFETGGIMILLSLAMIPFGGEQFFDQLMSILLRDVLMIFGLGICFVTTYCMDHHTWKQLGIIWLFKNGIRKGIWHNTSRFINSSILQFPSCRLSTGIFTFVFGWHDVCECLLYYKEFMGHFSFLLGHWCFMGCAN